MAGRGRGRGMSFNVEQLGFGRNEALPQPTEQPPLIYPNLEYLPVELTSDDSLNYLMALKQEMRTIMHESKYFIKPVARKKDIMRYSDKYHSSGNQSEEIDLINSIDWNRLPSELKLNTKRKKSASKVKVKLNIDEKIKHLEKIEKSDENDDNEVEEETETKEEKSGDENEEYYDEEDNEEGTDYAVSYFDNGENYLDEEDDNMDDGPTY